MTVRFTEVHMSAGGAQHEHIEKLKAVGDGTGTPYEDTREKWHDWIKSGNSGYVRDSAGDTIGVRAMTNANGTRYVQTYADYTPKDNLLWLPRY
jgi:uncharacterized protein DUF3892